MNYAFGVYLYIDCVIVCARVCVCVKCSFVPPNFHQKTNNSMPDIVCIDLITTFRCKQCAFFYNHFVITIESIASHRIINREQERTHYCILNLGE